MPNSADTDSGATEAEQAYTSETNRHLPHNYLIHLIHGMLGQTGFRIFTAPTFMPAFIALISGGSSFIVGLYLSLQALGMSFSPLVGAHLVDHRKHVLPWGLTIGWLVRLMMLSIALTALFLSDNQALIALGLCMVLLGSFMGIQGVIFTFLMAKVIPQGKRGKLTGLRNFCAGIITSIVAYLAGEYLIGAEPGPQGYGYTFLLAFALASAGLLFLMLMREPAQPDTRPFIPISQRMQAAVTIMREDRRFMRYVLGRFLGNAGRMAVPFYILYASENIQITGQTLGILTLSFTFASTISNLVWGAIGDRTGFIPVLLGTLSLWVLSTLLLMNVSDLWNITLAFVGIGAAFQGFQNASVNATLEFGKLQDLPMRIAVTNTTSEWAGVAGPLIGGMLVVFFSYEAVFWISIGFLVIGGALLASLIGPRRSRLAGL